MRPSRFVTALLLAGFFCAPRTACAAMSFCNRTQNAIETAFGYRDTGGWVSEGWWRIEPGECARVFSASLTQRFYFYYGTSLGPHPKDKQPLIWGGKYKLCVDTKAFRIEGDQDCEQRNYKAQNFAEVDIGSMTHDYALEFKENNDSH